MFTWHRRRATACDLDPGDETSLFRIIREALANTRKHRASRISVTIFDIADVTVIDIQDVGVGFDADAAARRNASSGVVLNAMHERVAELGGRLIVESVPGEGTTVVVELPV